MREAGKLAWRVAGRIRVRFLLPVIFLVVMMSSPSLSSYDALADVDPRIT